MPAYTKSNLRELEHVLEEYEKNYTTGQFIFSIGSNLLIAATLVFIVIMYFFSDEEYNGEYMNMSFIFATTATVVSTLSNAVRLHYRAFACYRYRYSLRLLIADAIVPSMRSSFLARMIDDMEKDRFLFFPHPMKYVRGEGGQTVHGNSDTSMERLDNMERVSTII